MTDTKPMPPRPFATHEVQRDRRQHPTSHSWVGPRRGNVYVHCENCGKIFEVLKSKSVCHGS